MNLSLSTMDDVAGLIRQVAAAEVMPRFRHLEAGDVATKTGPHDLVTIADREAEARLTAALPKILPGSVVVGEEACAADPARTDLLTADAPVWLVDPVDGTANFVSGSDRFAVMVALVHRGQTLAGWIYPPGEDIMVVAHYGGGAAIDGVVIPSVAPRGFSDARGDYSSRYFAEPFKSALSSRLSQAGAIREGHCSAYAYLDTARGDLDFVMQWLMTPWDHAAGTLLLQETGGAARFLDDGSPYTPVAREPRLMLAVRSADQWAGFARDVLP